MNFTYDAYRKMLNGLRSHGYEFADYVTCDDYERCVILRHDIDISIDSALEMAILEAGQNVRSTYFVLLTSEFYNVAARGNKEKLLKIKELGHDVGLHFDELNYEQNLSAGGVIRNIKKEADLLENILGVEIKSVSMHRPSKMTLEADYDLSPLINSYGRKFFKNYKYLSDSRMRWRENVNEIIEYERYAKLHILTHAFSYNSTEKSLQKNISDFVNSGNKDRYRIMARNITDMDSIMKQEEII